MFSTYNFQISSYPFIQIGFVLAVIVPFVLLFTFPITKKRTKKWAYKFVGTLTWGYVGIALIDIIYAVATGQLQGFLESFGWPILLEMIAFAAGWFLLMLFMANKAVAGMPDDPTPAEKELSPKKTDSSGK